MNNYRKSKIFGRKEKINLFVLMSIVLFAIFVIYLSMPSKTNQENNQLSGSEVAKNSIEQNQNLNIDDNTMENALQVKEDSNSNLNKNEAEDLNNKNDIVKNDSLELENTQLQNETESKVTAQNSEEVEQVSSKESITFGAPVEGSLIREYTNDTVYSKTLNTWRTREGIDFKAEIGTSVMSVLDGVVEKIDNDLTERGQYIVIKHDNGFKTVYTNLDDEIKVVNGQRVKKGEVIASVGQTSGNYSNEDYGTHFNFIMYLNNEEVNPSKYINFK